jgi:acyl carrier protein phosphodiesterase
MAVERSRWTDERLDELANRVMRQDVLETRFDGLEARFDGLERRFDGFERAISSCERRSAIFEASSTTRAAG